MPGGYLNQFEKIEDGCIRELKEETKLKVPEPVLRGSIKQKEVFDHPLRDVRGRCITHAFYMPIEPNADGSLPKVKGGDDAAKADWVELKEVTNNPRRFFVDHYIILEKFIGRLT